MHKASINTDIKNNDSCVTRTNSFSVCKFRKNRNGMSKYDTLYDCISNLEDAYLLAQLAMS